MNAAFDREWDRLEEDLANPDNTEADKKEIRRLMREMQREATEQETWEQQGNERGWR
jgi:hypothetical protein